MYHKLDILIYDTCPSVWACGGVFVCVKHTLCLEGRCQKLENYILGSRRDERAMKYDCVILTKSVVSLECILGVLLLVI